jgi:hypothetical protein
MGEAPIYEKRDQPAIGISLDSADKTPLQKRQIYGICRMEFIAIGSPADWSEVCPAEEKLETHDVVFCEYGGNRR